MNSVSESAYLAPTAQRRLGVRIGGYSSAGLKPRNEDAFAARVPDDGGDLELKGVVACIADGAGCSDNAQLASETSVTHFISDYYSTPDTWPVRTAAARVLSALNAWLFHHGRQALRPTDALVTTFSAVILKSTTMHVLHAGDSRVWLWRNRRLELLTRDHLQPRREGTGFLTRALGMDDHLEVDYRTEELAAGDLIVLTTDGLHGVLAPSDLLATLCSERPLELLARQLVEQALAGGSTDNVSCLLVAVDELPAEGLDELHHRLAQLALPPALQEGQTIDGYRVERVLHNGTRSHVYAVQDQRTGARYALKAPSALFADDARYLEAFAREQWVGGRIDHPAVMRCQPRPSSSPFLYIVCEYIEGQTLRQWMHDHPHPSLTAVRTLIADIAAGLRALQRLRMSHRDLKPENVMVTTAGRARIIDFGAVHVAGLEEVHTPLADGVPAGSVDYIAPEYLAGQPGCHTADLYSLGVLAYEMLAGELPFRRAWLENRQPRPLKQAPRPLRCYRPDLPLWVDLSLRKAMEPNPARRYQALSELLHDLSHPNRELMTRHTRAPLMERDPVRAWQVISFLLAVVLIVQTVFLATT